MKKTAMLFLGLALLSGCTKQAPERNAAELDRVLRTATDQKQVPGAVAMVATADGVVYENAFGLKKDTIFAIASMTKPVTSVAVMQLVEAGKVNLDQPASTYLPELAAVKVLEKGALRARKGDITVRQLLTHTSGFAYDIFDAGLHDYVAQSKIPGILAGSDGFLQSPLIFDPGERWEYGIGVDWLGKLVERVS